MDTKSTVFVAGHRGLVGSALVRMLKNKGYENILLKSRDELDLLDQAAVNYFFQQNKIDYVIIAAAKVGGILYNSRCQADFLYENLVIAATLINAAANNGVRKLLYLGSSCIYPKLAEQPLKEEYLLTGPLEPTNEGYAIAKIAGLKLCEKYNMQYGKCFISAMPTNLYGPGDNFHPENSHVIPGMMRRFHFATLRNDPEVVVWGTGSPRREFLHVDDLAEGLHVLMQRYHDPQVINIGSGEDIPIKDLAYLMKDITGYKGEIVFDTTKPDGTPRKVMDVSKIKALDWKPDYSLEEGLRSTYEWVLENKIFENDDEKDYRRLRRGEIRL